MKVIWLGQAGLLFDNGKTKIIIDPYLSDSVAQVNPRNYRRVPVDARFFDVSPDVMIFTHDHLDHYDPETASRFLAKTEKRITVLAPTSVWNKVRTQAVEHNYVQFNRGTEWTEHEFRFRAIRAEHSDPFAIGITIEDLQQKKTYYITGDTLYNEAIFADLPTGIDVVFLPVNGVGNNMNALDAARFSQRTNAVKAVPLHTGMFDENTGRIFPAENRIVPEIYREIPL